MGRSDRRSRSIFRRVNFTVTLVVMGSFFIFVPLVASGGIKATRLNVGIAWFLYAYLWVWIFVATYASAARLCGFRPITLSGRRFKRALRQRDAPSAIAATVLFALSYASTLYGFALAYTFVSRMTSGAFNVGTLSLFDGIYFSLMTAATVGFGDIAPTSTLSRTLTMLEVVANLIYAIFFFSVVPGAIREGSRVPPNA